MKITVGNLRRIIKEVLKEETKFPGGAFGGGRLDPEDQERLANGGFLGIDDLEELDEEDSEAKNQ